MARMRWEGENLEKLKILNYYTQDRKAFAEKGKELFPHLTAPQLKVAVDNARRRGVIPRYSQIADEVIKRTPQEEEEEDYEYQTKADRKIVKLQDELRRVRKLYKEQTKHASGNEALIGAIHEVVPSMKPVTVPERVPLEEGIEEEELVLLLSDLHFGEVVDEDETGGISVYNLDIAKRRLEYTVRKTVTIAKEKQKGFHYRKLNIFMLGDLVSGIIHDELKQNDEVGIVKQMLHAVDAIAEAILMLCQEFEEVRVTSVVGNHGRVSEKYYFKGKANNNFDYLVSKMLEKLTADQPNLSWNVPESFWAMEEVCGDTFFLSHGDFVRSWSGIPWYGLSRAYLKWRTLAADYGISFDHMVIGHFHNPNVFTMVRGMMFVNGSTKGGDEYAIGAISAACDPVQLLFGMNPTRRGPTSIWHVNSAHIR